MKNIKNLLIYSLIVFITIIIFDTMAYLSGSKEKYFPLLVNRLTYPVGYFVADLELGHDIKRSHPGVIFNWRDSEALVFSNKYACFDKNETYRNPLIYLAGDSVAWGYNDYANKFGTLVEEELNIQVAKCGVTHTGQYHQLKKLQRWISETKIIPNIIAITWVENDPENDFLFPQSTVINDKFIDQATVTMINGKPVRTIVPEIQDKIAQYEKASEKQNSTTKDLIYILKKYSTTANIIRKSFSGFIGNSLRKKIAKKITKSAELDIRNVNFKAIDQLIQYTKENKIKLLFVVYSTKNKYIIEYLEKKEQHYINYKWHIDDMGILGSDTRWPIDGHPNTAGNKILSKLIVQYVRAHFQDKNGQY